MKHTLLILTMVVALPASAHWTGHVHLHYSPPSAPTVPSLSPLNPSLSPHLPQVPSYNPPRNDYNQRLNQRLEQDRRRQWRDQQLLRQQDAIELRNRYTITGCHRYNRGCLNELRSLGR